MTPAERTEQARRDLDRAHDLTSRRRERLAGCIVAERSAAMESNLLGAELENLVEQVENAIEATMGIMVRGPVSRRYPLLRAMLALEEARKELDQ